MRCQGRCQGPWLAQMARLPETDPARGRAGLNRTGFGQHQAMRRRTLQSYMPATSSPCEQHFCLDRLLGLRSFVEAHDSVTIHCHRSQWIDATWGPHTAIASQRQCF